MIKSLNDYSLSKNEKNIIEDILSKSSSKYSKRIVEVLVENKADFVCLVCGALLEDYRKDNEFVENFELPNICLTILSSILKIEGIKIVNEEISTNNIKNLLISMANDIRVIIIKLAETVVFCENPNALSKEELSNLHLLVKELYVPICARLGLSVLKNKLQDLSLKYYHPKDYEKITKELNDLIQNRDEEINKNKLIVQNLLKKLNIEGEVYGRAKHISSIYNKLQDKHKKLNQIYDLLAIRVIVNTEEECYEVLSNINSIYEPLDNRFKDYIARPKPNGYKSIHTTVITENNDPLEIQIRTKDMHEFAEYGIAAHFLYKEKKSKLSSFDDKLIWIRKMLENTDLSTASDYLDELKTDLYANEIFVQTPLGKVINLTENATPIDFAYLIHTDVGNKCVGCKVNNKLVPLTTKLNNGDIVEIITNPNAKPSRDWLKIVTTHSARSKLNSFFKKEMKEENIKSGKQILEATSKQKKIDLKNLLNEEWLQELYDKWSLKGLDDLYASVGYGSLTSTQVINKLFNKYRAQQNSLNEIKIQSAKKSNVENGICFENNLQGLMVKFAKCCSPIPGDEIVGFISKGSGIIVHTKDCKNVQNFNEERLINVKFSNEGKLFNAHLIIFGEKLENLVMNVTKIVFNEKLSLTGLSVLEGKEKIIHLYVEVKDIDQLQDLINKLSVVKGVIDIKRAKENKWK